MGVLIETAKGIPEFNEEGCLPHKCYEVTLDEIKEKLVDNFPNSKTRQSRYEGFLKFYGELTKNVDSCIQILIDGSFVESKLNPFDIDLVIIIDSELVDEFEYNYLNNEFKYNEFLKQEYFLLKKQINDGLIDSSELYKCEFYKFGCDIHYFPRYRKNHPLYERMYKERLNSWIELFGKSRKKVPKGFLNLIVNEGGLNEQ